MRHTNRAKMFAVSTCQLLVGLLLLLLGTLAPQHAMAETVSLAWDANTEPDLAGYVVAYGTQSGVYGSSVDVGKVTTWSVQNLTGGQTYYFVVKAYNTSGLYSGLSSEVSALVPVSQPVTTQLTISRAGSGSGTVTSNPSGISCGATCTKTFAVNTVVTLTATAAQGSTFAGWSGHADCADGSVTLSADRSCTATFTAATPTLSINKLGTGSGQVTSTPAGISCGATCTKTFAFNTVVALTATAAQGSTFAGWSGHADCADGSVTLSADRSCTATFTAATPTLSINKLGTGSGQVTSTPAGISCGATCTKTFAFNTVVALTATAAQGSTFAGWSGHTDCADGSVTLSADRSCTATFTAATPTLSINKLGTGSGQVTSTPAGISCGATCTKTFAFNTVVALTATAAQGSTFAGWSGHADCADGSVTLSADRSCTATFTAATPTLSINKLGTGSGQVTSTPAGISCGATCTKTFAFNTVVALTATAAQGSIFAGWGGHADCADGTVTLGADRACTATFTAGSGVNLTITKLGLGAGSGRVVSAPAGIDCGSVCTHEFAANTTVTLSAPATPGAVFVGWSGDPDCADGVVTLSGGRACSATFKLGPVAKLTVTKLGAGSGHVTSEPAGIDCGETCIQAFAAKTTVTLSAVAAEGSVFEGWTGAPDCADGQVTLNYNMPCTANFAPEPDGNGLTLVPGSATTTLVSEPAKIGRHDVAFDSTSGKYMLVWTAGKKSTVMARFIDGDGQPIGAAFTIAPAGSNVRVIPADGAQSFLVTYVKGRTAVAQFVTFNSNSAPVIGQAITFASWPIIGATGEAVYVTARGHFLMTWSARRAGVPAQSYLRTMGIDGSLGSILDLTSAPLEHSSPTIACGVTLCKVTGRTVGRPTRGTWMRDVNFDGSAAGESSALYEDGRIHNAPRAAYSPSSDTFVAAWATVTAIPLLARVSNSGAEATSFTTPPVRGSNPTIQYNSSSAKFALVLQKGQAVWAQGMSSAAGLSGDRPFQIAAARKTILAAPVVAANPTLGQFMIVYKQNGTVLKAVLVQ